MIWKLFKTLHHLCLMLEACTLIIQTISCVRSYSRHSAGSSLFRLPQDIQIWLMENVVISHKDDSSASISVGDKLGMLKKILLISCIGSSYFDQRRKPEITKYEGIVPVHTNVYLCSSKLTTVYFASEEYLKTVIASCTIMRCFSSAEMLHLLQLRVRQKIGNIFYINFLT